jgi:hypothetical protein
LAHIFAVAGVPISDDVEAKLNVTVGAGAAEIAVVSVIVNMASPANRNMTGRTITGRTNSMGCPF